MSGKADRSVPAPVPSATADAERRLRSLERLLQTVQDLSLARTLEDIQRIVRQAARELTGCDGATFVLREGDQCHYLDEDAIAPLWKGRHFPMDSCISGWAMLHKQPAVIPDIYLDARTPHEAYQPTFVRSLVMVPIRKQDPLGAIGNYWATLHQPSGAEVALLQALADSTAVAIENVRAYAEMERRVQERTAALEQANAEISMLSITDELTGLSNRRGFYTHAEQELRHMRRSGGNCALVFIDLDGLKLVNDRIGHDAGDLMLADFAEVLRRTFREQDILARTGGDEFCVLALDTVESPDILKRRLEAQIDAYNRGTERPYRLSASIGVVGEHVTPSTSLEALITQADTRMYRHKRSKGSSRSPPAAA